MLRRPSCLVLLLASCVWASGDVLVTGATGRTGRLIYAQLKARRSGVRALVTDINTAQQVLNCSKCDATEGVFLADVTDPASLVPAFAGVTSLAIAVGITDESASEKELEAVEYLGVVHQVTALVNASANPAAAGADARLRVALLSSAGTTIANPSPQMGGPVLFWKLNAEAFLSSAAADPRLTTISLKPGGLDSPRAGPRLLLAPATDTLATTGREGVSRTDVARVMVAALQDITLTGAGLRLDMGSTQGAITTDDELAPLLTGGLWPWQQQDL